MKYPMQSPKPAAKHWSVHPWKLAGVLVVAFGVVEPIVASVATFTFILLSGVLDLLLGNAGGTPMATDIWGKLLFGMPLLSMLAAGFFVPRFVLRAQERHGLENRAQNRMSWIALPGILVALALALPWLLQPLPDKPDTTGPLLFSSMATPIGAGIVALQTGLLLPVLQRRAGLTVSALILAAIRFVPALLVLPIQPLLGKDVQLFPWIITEPGLSLAAALVASALFVAMNRRLWDAVALLAGLASVLGKLESLWNRAGSAAIPDTQSDIHSLILWAVPALVALVFLLLRDRQSAKGPPTVAAPGITELND